MKLTFQRHLLFLLFVWALIPNAYGQKEPADTTEESEIARRTQADGIFYDAIRAKMRSDTAEARTLFEKFAQKQPEVSDTYYELSRLAYGNHNADKAEEYIKKAIKLDDHNKWYKEEYGTILADRGNYEDAAKIMTELATQEPDDKQYPLMAAEYFERSRNYNEAISYLDKALVQAGSDDEILMHKVQIFLEMKQPDKAAAILEQMITNDPRNGQLYKTLAEIYDNNKQPDKATAVLERGQKVIPDDAFVQIGMALHYNKIGDTAAYLTYVKKVVLNKDLDAESQIGFLKAYIPSLQSDSAAKVQGLPMARQLVAMHPDDPDVLVFYAELQQYFGMHDSALIALKKAVALKPSDYGHWEKLLGEFRGKQEADSLIRYSEKAIRMFPVKAFIWYFNAIGHSLKDDYPAAIKSMKKAIQMQPESDTEMLGGMYSEMGNIYHSAKMDDLSDQAFEKALKLTPNDATLLNNYSYFLSERGKKLDEAEKMSKKSLTLMPDQATFLDTYGWIMYKKGNYPKAKEYIEKAILLSGPRADGTLYDHLGNIYYKLNEKGKALENWKISKEKGSDDPFIDKKISEEKLYE